MCELVCKKNIHSSYMYVYTLSFLVYENSVLKTKYKILFSF